MQDRIIKLVSRRGLQQIESRMSRLFGKQAADQCMERLYFLLGRYGVDRANEPGEEKWNESDAVLITYADQVQNPDEVPLQTLEKFCREHLSGVFSTIHILPFCPWSSDDGFSVIDYRAVETTYGSWQDIEEIGKSFHLMFDLVLNHCSSQSRWFRDFRVGIQPARHYFIEIDPRTDLSEVVRPRTSPLLTAAQTREGETHVWTTFSADQVDLNWQNPDVLFEFLDILLQYIAMGCRILRLDAIAFLWKIPGTSCLHLEETHEIVKLLRDFIDMVAPDVILLTETNVPHQENISYFGNGSDEAHMVYQFSLPPLLLHGLLQETSQYLQSWAKGLPQLPETCTFLNFTASHDGIGVRPLQDILTKDQILNLAEVIKSKGGKVSSRTLPDGTSSPYELNITYLSALDDPDNPELGQQRFLCSQMLAMSLQGIPAIYFQSLVGAENDLAGLEQTGRNRSINRKKWQESELLKHLNKSNSRASIIFSRIREALNIRASEPAFHPAASQYFIDTNYGYFALVRQNQTLGSRVLCIYNFTSSCLTWDHLENNATDLLSNMTFGQGDSLQIQPFQALWLKFV